MGFSEKYIDHFTNPRGIGEIESPDMLSETAHEGGGCFDKVRLTLRISAGKIIEAKFRARACSGTIAACSALVELLKGRDVTDAASISEAVLIEHLGGIPEKKRHSVELAVKSLNSAIEGRIAPGAN